MKPAPIFVDANRLCQWLLEHLDGQGGTLSKRICETALDLVQTLTLALKSRDRETRIEIADERLIVLRLQLRLAESTGLLSDAQVLHALEEADLIGRQLGGWRRKLGAL